MLKVLFKKCRIAQSYAKAIGLYKGEWILVLLDYVNSKLRYGFTTQDYFVIGNGFTLSKYEKKRFFSYNRAFKYMKEANDADFIHIFDNKAETLLMFRDFVSRKWLYTSKSSFDQFMDFAKETPIFIAKPVGGMCGNGIEKHCTHDYSSEDLKILYESLVAKDMLLEECLKAHNDIYLGTTALSTFRVFTMIDRNGEVHILKAKYRSGVGNSITDTADGCIAYPISIKYGLIEGPGINDVYYSKNYYYHPGCDKLVVGMKIPKWDQVIDIVTKAAKKIPQVRFVGWDITVTNDSVEIIEGNAKPYHGTFEIMGTERLWWPKLKSLL